MKNLIFFFTLIFCVMLTSVSAQKKRPFDSAKNYLPGQWYTPDSADCGCRPGFYPLFNKISPTQWGCELKKCIKSGTKKLVPKPGVSTPPPPTADTCVEINNYDQRVYNYGDTCVEINNYDQRVYNYGDTTKPQPILGEAHTLVYAEVAATFPTDPEFDAMTPIVKIGGEVRGNVEKFPGLSVGAHSNVVVVPAAFVKKQSCPSCVPQDPESLIGIQLGVDATWQFGDRAAIRGYWTSGTRLVTERKVVDLPGDGWGGEFIWKFRKVPAQIFAGSATNKAGSAPYVGLRVDGWKKHKKGPLLKPARLTGG